MRSNLTIIAADLFKTYNRLFRTLLLVAGLITGGQTLAQEYTYIHYEVKDGLASSTVYDLCQDKDGFIWFATDAGVSRFDGTNFKNFTTADGLPETEVVRLFADSKGRVWMSPFKNSICYYYKGKIYNQENDRVLKQMNITSVIMDFAESPNGSIAFTTGKSGFVIRSDTLVDAFPRTIPALGNLILNVNPSGKGFRFLTGDTIFTFINGKIVSAEKRSADSGFHQVSRRLQYPPRVTVRSLMLPKEKVVFVNTYNGSWMVDTTTYARYQDIFLKGKQVSHALIDKEKNIWFSTLGQGVFKLASREFKTWYFNSNTTPEVFSLEKWKNKLFAGTGHGRIYSISGNAVDTLAYEKIFRKSISTASAERVVCLKQTKNGLIAGFDGLLVKDNGNDKKVNYKITANKSIDEVDDNTILVATARELVLVNAKDLSAKDTILTHRSTAACYYDDVLYMGTVSGLYIITKDKHLVYLGNTNPILRHRISYFKKSKDGGLWVATYGGGVVYMKNRNVIGSITTSQGISSNICRTLFLRDNYLWVGTDKGLNKVDISRQPYKVTTYTTSDGLPTDIVNAIYVEGDTVYVGSPAGLTVFNETKVSLSWSKCDLKVLDITVSNKSQPIQGIYHLNYKDNSLKISFAGISFKSGGDIWYRYRLKGLTDTWDSTRQTMLEYPSLPPGDYKLELIAINKKGVVSNPVYISFNVASAFWQTLPFQILVIAVAILVTWILVAWRFSIIRKQEQEKITVQQRLNDLEQMALRAQMNPHFIFNCLNSIQNFIITNNLEASNLYLTEFAHLIRQTLDNSEKGTISIANEVKYLKRYLELEIMRFGNSFSYSIEVDNDIDQELTHIPTMILQPYIENSIRHGVRLKQNGAGQIEIKFKKNSDDFICIIQDNGIGRKKAGELKSRMHVEYQSKGMSLTAERINILNRQLTNPITIEIIDLTDNHNQPNGTRIVIRFPGTVNIKPVRNDTHRNY